MESVPCTETSVPVYQRKRGNVPEALDFHRRCCGNLKSHKLRFDIAVLRIMLGNTRGAVRIFRITKMIAKSYR